MLGHFNPDHKHQPGGRVRDHQGFITINVLHGSSCNSYWDNEVRTRELDRPPGTGAATTEAKAAIQNMFIFHNPPGQTHRSAITLTPLTAEVNKNDLCTVLP